MLDYKHRQHRHERPQKFLQGWAKSTFCFSFSGCWRYNADGRSHNALPFLSPQIKCAMLRQMHFVGSNISFHTVQNYVTYCYQQSLSRCINYHRCLRSAVACGKTPAAVTWSEPLLPWHRYAIKANFITTCSQVWQPASAGNVADVVNCKQAYHCMTPEQWTWLLLSVSVISAKNCHCKN